MSTVDAIAIVFVVSIAVPLIVHRLKYGSAEQQSLRSIERCESHPDNIAMLQKLLDDIRDTTDPKLIEDFEAGMKTRRENAKKYWKVDL
jgi:hypothetical protein